MKAAGIEQRTASAWLSYIGKKAGQPAIAATQNFFPVYDSGRCFVTAN